MYQSKLDAVAFEKMAFEALTFMNPGTDALPLACPLGDGQSM
jgi:hypothetical protein